MDIARFLAARCGDVDFSGIRRFFDLAARAKDPIDLSIGQPDYDADPPVKEALIAAVREGHNRYTPTAGLPELREAIRESLADEFPGSDPAVLVASGVSGGLALALLATIGAGDEIVFLDPYFVSYRQLTRMLGGTPRAVPNYPDFGFDAARVERAVTDRTKVLLLNSPANPTGRVLTEAEIRSAVDLARRRDLLIVSDEIYRDLSFDGPAPSPAAFAPERTVLLRGFGKTYGVTGWRLAYAAGPAALIEQMAKMQQFTFVCAPAPMQRAALTALRTDVSHHRRDYARKRDLVVKALQGTFEFARPGGGFYIFPKCPATHASASAFCEAAAERNVFVIPGSIFSEADTHFRVSFATTDERLRRGCELLCAVARG